MKHRLHRRLGILGGNRLTGQLGHELARSFGGHRLQFAAGGFGGSADAAFRFGDACSDLLVDDLQALLRVESSLRLGFTRNLKRLAAACLDALTIGLFGSFRLLPRALAAARSSAIFLSRSSTTDWIFGTMPRPIQK
jgi:hypothetical protein